MTTTDQTTAPERQNGPETDDQATTTPEPAETQNNAQEGEEQAEDEQQEEEQSKPSREAQKLRKRLRETEAERDQLTAERDLLRRVLVDSHLTRGMTADAFWSAGHDPASLFGEDGAPNLDAIRDAEAVTRKRFNIAGTPKPDPSQGSVGGNTRDARTDWTNAFQYKH